MISNLFPTNCAIINTNTTTISATFSDARTHINLNNIILKISRIVVTSSAAITPTFIIYPASGLADGAVAIDLTVADAAGNVAAESWMFKINTTL